jgi:hypothetical protein
LADLLVKNDRWTEDAIVSFWTRLRTNQRLLELWINVDEEFLMAFRCAGEGHDRQVQLDAGSVPAQLGPS